MLLTPHFRRPLRREFGSTPAAQPPPASQTCCPACHPLPPRCRSELARVGKEKLLFAARDGLRGVRGRTALLSATVQVEPLLLPGAMALLHQVRMAALLSVAV